VREDRDSYKKKITPKEVEQKVEAAKKKYEKITKIPMPPELIAVYETVLGTKRGANGDYNDFKIILQLKFPPETYYPSGYILNQELSFYHRDNEIDL
jgi:hypothetical protein